MDFDALWDYAQPAATEARFRAAWPELAGDPARRTELLTQIARAQGLQGRFARAHAILDAAERGLAAAGPRAGLRYLLERGRVFNSAGQPDQARPYFQAAWEQGRAAGEDFYAVDAAHMLAIAAPPAEQVEWNLRALAQAEASADPRAQGWAGSLYNNLGWAYHDQGRYAEALTAFERAVTAREAQGQARETRIARWCVARAQRSLGRWAEALAGQMALLAEAEAAADPDGYIHEELAENLLALGRPAEARPHFARAHALLSADAGLAAQAPERLARLRALGAA